LLISRDGKLVSFDLARRQESALSHYPSTVLVAAPALAPDRQRVAFTYYVVPTNANDLGGSDLYVMDVDGSNARLIQAHGQSGRTFQAPCWAADGRAILASLVSSQTADRQTARTRTMIVRVPLDGSALTEITEGAEPNLSPDGKLLAYLATDPSGVTQLWVSNANGSDAHKLLADRASGGLQAPRFAPDGDRIAFAAVSRPATARRPTTLPRLAPFAPEIAEADGTPMDVWTVRTDGSDLRQLTATLDHNPYPAWSPDGKWLAMAGELSLTLVDANGTQAESIANNPRATGVVWLV